MPPRVRAPGPTTASGPIPDASGLARAPNRAQAFGATTGTVNQNVAPSPGSLAIPISPPCA
jgi:hypothetical protein